MREDTAPAPEPRKALTGEKPRTPLPWPTTRYNSHVQLNGFTVLHDARGMSVAYFAYKADAEYVASLTERIAHLEDALRAARVCLDDAYRSAASSGMRALLHAGREAAARALLSAVASPRSERNTHNVPDNVHRGETA